MQNVPQAPLFVLSVEISPPTPVILAPAFFPTVVEKACTLPLPLSHCVGKLSVLPPPASHYSYGRTSEGQR